MRPSSARPRYARTLRDSFMRPRAAWVRGTLGALPRGKSRGIGATRRRRFFVQGKESRRRRTGGTSSRRRRDIARKGKPFWREDPRDFPDPGREVRFLAPPGFHSEPCGRVSSSALCANIARFFYAAAGRMGLGHVRGFASQNPTRELSSLDLPLFCRLLASGHPHHFMPQSMQNPLFQPRNITLRNPQRIRDLLLRPAFPLRPARTEGT